MPVPDIRDNVRDSGEIFVFGTASSGERVDEKSALQIATVYACVRLIAESVAGLPLHLYRSEVENGKTKAKDHPLYKLLYRQPNPEMTGFSFWETMVTHILLWGNAYAQIVRDGKNTVLGLYPLLPENVEIDRDESGALYYIYHAYTDEVPGENNKDIYFQRDEILHIPGMGFNGLVGFSPIAMMKKRPRRNAGCREIWQRLLPQRSPACRRIGASGRAEESGEDPGELGRCLRRSQQRAQGGCA